MEIVREAKPRGEPVAGKGFVEWGRLGHGGWLWEDSVGRNFSG